MASSSTAEPKTIMRKLGRVSLRVAITSNRFWPERSPSSTRSMLCWVSASDGEEQISSKPRSEWNTARKPTNCRGSLPTTAIRMSGFFDTVRFIATLVCHKLSGIRLGVENYWSNEDGAEVMSHLYARVLSREQTRPY